MLGSFAASAYLTLRIADWLQKMLKRASLICYRPQTSCLWHFRISVELGELDSGLPLI